jgi:hypothetical protein
MQAPRAKIILFLLGACCSHNGLAYFVIEPNIRYPLRGVPLVFVLPGIGDM